MRDYASTTTPDHIEEAETAIGTQPLGRPGKILITFAALVFGALITFAACAPANAADGMTDLVLLTQEAGQYTSQVPPEPVITGHGCTISMYGQATPGSRVVLQVVLETGMIHTLAYADIGKDGMIRDVIFVSDRIIPGENRSVEVQIIETWFDDTAEPLVVATAHVGNPYGSGC